LRGLTLVAVVALAVLNGADVVTTHLILGHHSVVEANPLAGVLIGRGWLLWLKLTLVGLFGVGALSIRPRIGVLVLSFFAVGLYAASVLSNALILRLLN
jgi:hypothetical protein